MNSVKTTLELHRIQIKYADGRLGPTPWLILVLRNYTRAHGGHWNMHWLRVLEPSPITAKAAAEAMGLAGLASKDIDLEVLPDVDHFIEWINDEAEMFRRKSAINLFAGRVLAAAHSPIMGAQGTQDSPLR